MAMTEEVYLTILHAWDMHGGQGWDVKFHQSQNLIGKQTSSGIQAFCTKRVSRTPPQPPGIHNEDLVLSIGSCDGPETGYLLIPGSQNVLKIWGSRINDGNES